MRLDELQMELAGSGRLRSPFVMGFEGAANVDSCTEDFSFRQRFAGTETGLLASVVECCKSGCR